MWIVRLEDGVWLADWSGDPGRTLVRAFAKIFPTYQLAEMAVLAARKYRPFEDALIFPTATK